MRVGDIVIAGRNVFRIVGVYLGAVGTQNLVGLESLSLATGYACGGPVREMFVPEELVLTAGVYRRVDGDLPLHKDCGAHHDSRHCPSGAGSIVAN